jgi:hypothetical protein
MTFFKESDNLRIGKIIEVNGTSIIVELDNKVGSLTRAIDGKVYPIGQMSSIIKIHYGRKIIFAFVKMLRMRLDVDNIDIPLKDDSRILEADLFGEGIWNESSRHLVFSRGIESYPLPQQSVYLIVKEELEELYQSAEKASTSGSSPMVTIGSYCGSNSTQCKANIDKLFGNHCAILGSTGSGKSATVCAILHSVLEYVSPNGTLHPRIVLIDPHGEYAHAFVNKAIVYKAYSSASTGGQDTSELVLPYWLMSGDEFRSLVVGKTEQEATSQNNVVYESLLYARLVEAGIVKSLDNPLGDQKLEPAEGHQQAEIDCFDRDKPSPFKLEEFIKHAEQVQGRKSGSTDRRPPSDSQWQKVEAVLRKLRVLRSNPQLNFLLKEYQAANSPTLSGILSQLIGVVQGSENKCVRIVDISGLPNEVSGPLTALIARLLFQYKLWQTSEERKRDPILVACEEAHRYVPNEGEAQYKEAQESIRRIAKEGRKYGIGLMLVSQRPSDVESTVLSQCNTWIILRLTNSRDQEHVAKFLPDSLSGLTRILSSLTRREAIFVGEAAALPSRIRIRELNDCELPDSGDISFVQGWKHPLIQKTELDAITLRWVGR